MRIMENKIQNPPELINGKRYLHKKLRINLNKIVGFRVGEFESKV